MKRFSLINSVALGALALSVSPADAQRRDGGGGRPAAMGPRASFGRSAPSGDTWRGGYAARWNNGAAGARFNNVSTAPRITPGNTAVGSNNSNARVNNSNARFNNGTNRWANRNGRWDGRRGDGRRCDNNGSGHRHHRRCYPHSYYSGFYPYGYGYPWGWYGYPYGGVSAAVYYDATARGYRGSEGDLVGEVQQELARAGYYRGAIDGVIGPRTRSAIRAYERANRIPVDGRIDERLLEMMGLA